MSVALVELSGVQLMELDEGQKWIQVGDRHFVDPRYYDEFREKIGPLLK